MTGSTGRRDGRATRWEGQRERRRAEFAEAAITVIERHGPDVLTEQIAAQAGVARPRLYRHFDGKADLQHAVCQRIVQRLMAELAPVWRAGGAPHEIITSAIDTIVRWLGTHRQLYRYLARHSRRDPAGRSDAITDFTGAFAVNLGRLLAGALRATGLEDRGTEPFAFGLVAFVEAAIGRWLAEPEGGTAEQFTADLARSVWRLLDGILGERGLRLDPDRPLPDSAGIDLLDTSAR
ncbi:TetR/AcrR family transcriptional regulator [Amycolatopsis cihanbeyliensis]|uniref:TetR family transcriptional regulator n=1 Tax=Amycolatopsis cihanbeyliensis TaxID=1128664 RepID=A0A542DMN4_AMYCI|nr:TetR/AcrR family transcriptional regulator [Amycolatopsis cihanbeyliensis]TQJ04347.1 TetR family transcriptional regulator [Amycolatopsis cihanbeyliensis]